MIWKLLSFFVFGYLASLFGYPLTHDTENGEAEFPELAGLVLGCFVVFLAFVSLNPKDDKAIYRLATAFSTVGLGVGFSRVMRVVG